jgi:uncharacterized protein YqjF (DUF2071 family)
MTRPAPQGPWWGRQTWHSLAFLHWPVPAESLRRLVPPGLTIDQCEHSAWVAVTPFWMSGVTGFRLPPIPRLSSFVELNTRTYVTRDGIPGVWFFSLDASSRPAVLAARARFHLPYFHARMEHRTEGERVHFSSRRGAGPGFEASYQPLGPVQESPAGSLAHFLTERYCLYASDGSGRLYRADIDHRPWALQPGAARIERNELLDHLGIAVQGEPLVHFAERLDVLVWSPRRVDSGASPVKP